MTRSHDYLVKSHMTTSRTCLLLSPPTSTNLQFLNQRRLLNVSVTGVDEPLSYIPTPVECCYELLEHIHEVSAMPWWLTILTASFLFRGAIVVPFSIWQHKVLANELVANKGDKVALTVPFINGADKIGLASSIARHAHLLFNKVQLVVGFSVRPNLFQRRVNRFWL